MTKTEFVKNPNTKTTYIQTEKTECIISEKQYNNIIGSSPFFRSLGGSERTVCSYTCRGYKAVKLTSISPDRQNKKIYEFEFID